MSLTFAGFGVTEQASSLDGSRKTILGQLIAVSEQVLYTSVSLLILVIALTQYTPDKSAANLALTAFLNLPVPFHAIQLGWQRQEERGFWLGSKPMQIGLYSATFLSMIAYGLLVVAQFDISFIGLVILAAFVAVWSNGARWVLIKRGDFLFLLLASLATLTAIIALQFWSLFSGFLDLFCSLVLAKLIFTFALLFRAKLLRSVSQNAYPIENGFDPEVAALAFSRFMRTNGIFIIMTAVAPTAALVGRLVQQAIAICRVVQNPLANFVFFHRAALSQMVLVFQLLLGICAALVFYFVSDWFDGDLPKILGSLSVFCASLGFIGTFILRSEGKRKTAVVVEASAATIFLSLAVFYSQADGFIIGLIASELLLFAAGIFILKQKGKTV